MKDYYRILGLGEDAGQQDIKKAFRRLAFAHHPDRNPGQERQAEENFKEINEAYGVLSDPGKRRQYDLARKGRFAGVPGFGYSQQDIFRDAFSNRKATEELMRMFGQAGLRFDQDFLNRVFFSGSGSAFRGSRSADGVEARRPGFFSRLVLKGLAGMGGFALRRLLGVEMPSPEKDLDQQMDLEISAAEAAAGEEKAFTCGRGDDARKLMVRIPKGVKPGTKIRLRGMGLKRDGKSGDLYLRVRVTG